MEKCRGRVEEPELSYDYEETFVNTVSSYKCELTDIVTGYTRPVQTKVRPNASTERVAGHTILPLTALLLATFSFLVREIQFSLRL